jgi:GTP-binding protein
MEIRNIAIIAHVDHGKTTLTNGLLKQNHAVDDDFSMDSNDLEKERGITIYSKNTSLIYKGVKINIVDTPGHADFGSEVERVLRSIDSVLLVVDAQEGPMPQTKFVLKKSLELGLNPIVVINKIDKPSADPKRTHDQVLELFMDLGANDKQLDFPTVYAIGREGIAKRSLSDDAKDLSPILDVVLAHVQPASANTNLPLRLQPFNLAYDTFVGRMAIGRVYEGVVKIGQQVTVVSENKLPRFGKITNLYTFVGNRRESVEQADAGDIVMIAGLPDIYIGETICQSAEQQPLPAISIDEPTISLNFLVNNSPFAGRDGRFITNRLIKERLERELEVNVGLKVDFSAIDHYKVFGRGELHIAILLENMRREGYELQISQPQVILKQNESGQTLEPFEEATITVPENMSGAVIEKLAKRKGELKEMKPEHGHLRFIFIVPTRGLLGYRNELIIDTKGEGILYTRVIGFFPFAGNIDKNQYGSMISMENGKTAAYSLANLQNRGVLYFGAGVEVYEGIVVGSTSKGNDMAVNPVKGKHLTNMRASGADDAIQLTPPLELTLERGMELMREDEYLEITPKSIRLRKRILKEVDRIRAQRQSN